MRSRIFTWVGTAALVSAVAASLAEAQITSAEQQVAEQQALMFWQNQEMARARAALANPFVNQRVQRIWLQLVRYSGKMFPVVPSQQFTKGQALGNGVVLLDLSAAAEPDVEVTAFWLAHEYGHQVLGHTRMTATPLGRYLFAQAGTSQEDAADRWSAQFLKKMAYPIEPVIASLCTLPSVSADRAHTQGPQRAVNVARAYGVTGAACDAPIADKPIHSAQESRPAPRQQQRQKPNIGRMTASGPLCDVLQQLLEASTNAFAEISGARRKDNDELREMTVTMPQSQECFTTDGAATCIMSRPTARELKGTYKDAVLAVRRCLPPRFGWRVEEKEEARVRTVEKSTDFNLLDSDPKDLWLTEPFITIQSRLLTDHQPSDATWLWGTNTITITVYAGTLSNP